MDIKTHPTLLSGLLAYYKLDGNANDSHTNVLNGTAIGTPTWPTAMLKTGFQANGSSQYIDLGANALFSPTAISISAWVYLAATPSGVFSLVTKRTAFSTWADLQWTAEVDSARKIRFEVGLSDSTGVTVLSASALTLSTWYHVVCVYDGTDARVYLNGYLNNTATGAGTIHSKTYPCVVGARADGSTPWTGRASYLNGRMDEVAIAGRAWTVAEVIDLYHTGYPLRYEEVVSGVGNVISDSLLTNCLLPAVSSYFPQTRPRALARDLTAPWYPPLKEFTEGAARMYENVLFCSADLHLLTKEARPIWHAKNVGMGTSVILKRGP